MKLLQFDFPYQGPWGDEMAAACAGLAQDIANTPGMLWKIWIENKATGNAGGIYLFADEPAATSYLEMHTARLQSLGIRDIRARIFDVNQTLSQTTRATFCNVQTARSAG